MYGINQPCSKKAVVAPAARRPISRVRLRPAGPINTSRWAHFSLSPLACAARWERHRKTAPDAAAKTSGQNGPVSTSAAGDRRPYIFATRAGLPDSRTARQDTQKRDSREIRQGTRTHPDSRTGHSETGQQRDQTGCPDTPGQPDRTLGNGTAEDSSRSEVGRPKHRTGHKHTGQTCDTQTRQDIGPRDTGHWKPWTRSQRQQGKDGTGLEVVP